MFKKLIAIPTALALMLVLGFGAFGFASDANAQAANPRLGIQLLTSGLTSPLEAEDEDATVARLVLDTTASTEAVRISTLPFILTTGNGAVASDLSNCMVVNEADADDDLSAGVTLNAGLNNVALSNTLTLAANTVTTLALQCDVDEDLVTNGTYTFSMNTANVVATGASTGLQAIVYIRGAVVPPVVVPPPVVVVPGLPTTGGEDAARNIAIILGSTVMGILGLAALRRVENRA